MSSNPLHGKVIQIAELGKVLPARKKYLDPALYNKVGNALKAEKEILFFPNAIWDDKPMQAFQYDKARYKIVLFGILEDGRNMSVVINGIEPFIEVKIPDDKVDKRDDFAIDLIELLNISIDEYDTFKSAIKKKNPDERVADNVTYWKIEPIRHEIVAGKPFKYFQEQDSYYVRIYFNKLDHRKDAIRYLHALDYETVHDDKSCYYRVVCRDTLLSFSSWIKLSDFTVQSSGTNSYIKGDVIQVSIDNIDIYDIDSIDGPVPNHIKKDNTLSMCWDIETYSLNDDAIPQPTTGKDAAEKVNWNHRMFMIGITFQWIHVPDCILRVCLVDVPSAPNDDFLTVICGDEKNLIKGFAKCCEKMTPDIILGYNDAGYDWSWLVKRAEAYPGMLKYLGEKLDRTIQEKRDDKTVKRGFSSIQVKIEADLYGVGNNLQLPGYIPIDVMIVFRQLYPTSEKWSLNFFLQKNKLAGKEDMPYHEMFKIYKTILKSVEAGAEIPQELLHKMSLVSKYCVIDAQKCHELMLIRVVIQDRREVSNMSYTSVFDAFYRANGMKVRNLVIARAQLKGLKMSNIANKSIESGKYPGAVVFPPIKGLVTSKLSISERIAKANMAYDEYSAWAEKSEDDIKRELQFIGEYGASLSDENKMQLATASPSLKKMIEESTGRPITGLDFSSLYPSLIMAYNLSPEYIVIDKKYARYLNELRNEDGTKKHNLHRIEFPFNGRIIKGWSIRHDNKLDPTKLDYKFGIFPAILKELFDTRKKLKTGPNGLGYWAHTKEKLLLIKKKDEEEKKKDKNYQTKWETKEVQEQWEDACFNYNAINSKQSAVKVFMNTFYGEAGNKTSPLFMLQVAGGITTAGQSNVKKAYKFVQKHGCKVYYGDSVPADSPIIIKFQSGAIDIVNIDSVPGAEWQPYPQFKAEDTEPVRIEKQQHLPVEGLKVWSARGWVPINRVIRHKTNKCMYRVSTRNGVVDVTEDHSLMNENREALKPRDTQLGTRLYHSFPPMMMNCDDRMPDKYLLIEAYVYGFFHGSGTCSDGEWSIHLQDMSYAETLLKYLHIVQPDEKFYADYEFSKVYVTRPVIDDCDDTYNRYLNKMYVRCGSNLYKKVPIAIVNSQKEIRHAYLNGLCNSQKADIDRSSCVTLYSKISMQSVYYLYRSLNMVYEVVNVGSDIYSLYNRGYISNFKEVTKIQELAPSNIFEYVYDIETEDGTFLTGVGSINCFQTDSLYLAMPDSLFRDLDQQYYTERITKLQYWESMVTTTFNSVQLLRDQVNQMFKDDNGTDFLKMAYEEVMFPVLFAAKKKYAGIPHEDVPNFSEGVPLFIRGLELKKRGVSNILKTVCGDILNTCMRVDNTLTVIEITQNKIREVYATDWTDRFDDFIMTAVYKTNKRNVKVHTFRDRMLQERDIELQPGERINYIIAKKYPFKYDTRGRKTKLSVGDKMELAEIAKKESIAVDLDYYMENSINGQLARFITYHEDFHEEPSDYSDNVLVKKAEDKILKNARKFIDNYCQMYYAKHEDQGPARKKIFRVSSKIVANKLADRYSESVILKLLGFSVEINDEIDQWIMNKIYKDVEKKKEFKTYGADYVDNELAGLKKTERKQKILQMQDTFYANKQNNISKQSEELFSERQNVLSLRLEKSLVHIKNLFNANNQIIESLVRRIDSDGQTDIEGDYTRQLGELADEEINKRTSKLEESLIAVKCIYINAIGNYEYIYRIRSIVAYLKELRDIQMKSIKRPSDIDDVLAKAIRESVDEYIHN